MMYSTGPAVIKQVLAQVRTLGYGMATKPQSQLLSFLTYLKDQRYLGCGAAGAHQTTW